MSIVLKFTMPEFNTSPQEVYDLWLARYRNIIGDINFQLNDKQYFMFTKKFNDLNMNNLPFWCIKKALNNYNSKNLKKLDLEKIKLLALQYLDNDKLETMEPIYEENKFGSFLVGYKEKHIETWNIENLKGLKPVQGDNEPG